MQQPSMDDRKLAMKVHAIQFFYCAIAIHLLPYIVTATPQLISWVLGAAKIKKTNMRSNYYKDSRWI